jgi:ribosomal protein S12 methylthiotransferase accessory factor
VASVSALASDSRAFGTCDWLAQPTPPRRVATSVDGSLTIPVPAEVDEWLAGGIVGVNVGFDLVVEGRNLVAAQRDDRQLLSIRFGTDEVFIGPRWVPGARVACAGCAETRMRQAVDHPLVTRGDVNASPRSGWPAALAVLVDVGLDHLGDHPLEPGEMLVVGLTQTRRHRVARSNACPVCGPDRQRQTRPAGTPTGAAAPPGTLALQPCPSDDAVPLRGRRSPSIGEQGEQLARLVDYRVGPVLQLTRDDRAPFAMSGALVPTARAMGYGRGGDFARSGWVAILEAYERLGAVPSEGQIVRGVPYDQVRDISVDPATFGHHSPAQLAHRNAQVRSYRPDLPMDWAYGHRLADGEPRLVPADVAFYGYDYPLPSGGGSTRDRRPHRVFADSSSGCALGSSLEEAALHALLELIERDAFLMAWCRRVPLAAIAPRSIDDPITTLLLETIDGRGFDVHLLATTYDLGLPSIWALAVNRTPDAVPATFSAAGSSPIPGDAVRAALWELAQLVAHPVDWDVEAVGPLVQDPSQVDTIEDHIHLYAMPAMRERILQVVGGPVTTLADAFPGWPDDLSDAARGDVRGALEYLLARCREAGLDEALVVDQSTREHHDLGLRVARVIVPGMLPMCFGSPQQRLSGLPRRGAALAALGRQADSPAEVADLLLDPHPFP